LIAWEDSSPEMTYYVSSGTLNLAQLNNSDIFARCGQTVNPLLENTRSTEEELTGIVRMQAFNGLKVKAKDLDFGLNEQGQVRGVD